MVKGSYELASKLVADMIRDELEKKPNMILGLATGSTPLGVYKELIRLHKEEGVDFSNITTFNLDEYVGLGKDHPQSYYYYMRNILFNHINIREENIFIQDGKAEDFNRECERYDELIKEKGGIDLQILGIGENGHIAFNEPADKLSVGTCIVQLTDSTINVNSRFFDSIEEVPKTAITMGIGSIMQAKKIILMADGEKKADIMKKLLESKYISTDIPASLLLLHQDLTIVLTRSAYKL